MRSRVGWPLLLAVVVPAAACIAFVLLRPAVEAEARARIERAGRGAGLSTTIGSVRLTPRLTVELRDLLFENAGRVRLMTRAASVRPRLSFRVPPWRTARVELERTVVGLPAGVTLALSPSTWVVESASPVLRVRRVRAGERLELQARGGAQAAKIEAHAANARLSGLVSVLVHGCRVADPGTVDGDARLERESSGALRLSVRARARQLALATWATEAAEGCEDGSMGAPTDAELEAEARLDPAARSLRADTLRIVAGGAELAGRLAVRGGVADPRVDLELRVPRVDFARLLATAGLELPARDLGWASLTARVSGPLLEPAALQVDERLDFTPPARPLPSIERLRGPFVHRAASRDGVVTLVLVGPDSPDFVPLGEVPPLFLRTLLIGEDSDFYGHRGVDLKELSVAVAGNLARGTLARGASTIPQQLAKNLFLSRERTVSRKLQELALALLLDSSLGKERMLEIYVNVIEWGPRLYGLRPAARHYFGKEPADLTAKQMAFLVALVPGPLKYQRSFDDGTPTPFFEGLIVTLLAKLHAVGALSDAEYSLALAEPLDLRLPRLPDQGPRIGDARRRLERTDASVDPSPGGDPRPGAGVVGAVLTREDGERQGLREGAVPDLRRPGSRPTGRRRQEAGFARKADVPHSPVGHEAAQLPRRPAASHVPDMASPETVPASSCRRPSPSTKPKRIASPRSAGSRRPTSTGPSATVPSSLWKRWVSVTSSDRPPRVTRQRPSTGAGTIHRWAVRPSAREDSSGVQSSMPKACETTRVPGRIRRSVGRSRMLSDGRRYSVTTVASEKSVSKMSPCTKRALPATPSACARRSESATSSGLNSTPTARAPRRAAPITRRPSPEPRS
jgi:hypothetical protein